MIRLGHHEFPIIEGFTRALCITWRRCSRESGHWKGGGPNGLQTNPPFPWESEHSEPPKQINRGQLFTLQKDFSLYKRLLHRVALRSTPAVHSKHYSIYTDAWTHRSKPGIFLEHISPRVGSNWPQPGASIPSHPPTLDSACGASSCTPLILGTHVTLLRGPEHWHIQ